MLKEHMREIGLTPCSINSAGKYVAQLDTRRMFHPQQKSKKDEHSGEQS